MTTKIEQIIADAISNAFYNDRGSSNLAAARVLTALDAGGLTVLPKALQHEMRLAIRERCTVDEKTAELAWLEARVMFDPTTYEPEPTE